MKNSGLTERKMANKKGTKVQPKEQTKAAETSMDVKINRMFNDQKSNLKALASVNIDNKFAVHGIRIVDSSKGLFISMPSTSYTDRNGQTQYSDIFHPITAQAREELIQGITNGINNSGLPLFVIESILKELLMEVTVVAKQQMEAEKAEYEQMLKEQATDK